LWESALRPLAAASLFLAWTCACAARPETVVVNLVDNYDVARKQPAATALRLETLSIRGIEQRSILTEQQTRLTYHVTVPRHAQFLAELGLVRSGHVQLHDDVLFLVGVSDGHTYRTAKSILVAADDTLPDHEWRPITVNLEEYAGLTIDLVLNTRIARVAHPEARPSVAAWTRPRVVVH